MRTKPGGTRFGIAVLAALLGSAAVATLACQRAESRESRAAGTSRPEAAGKDGKMSPKYSKSGFDVTPLTPERVRELAARLDPETYRITQKAGTERPFCGTLLPNKKEGVYACAVCGLPLFSSEQKFESGTGWPSFWRELDPAHVARKTDRGLGIERTEIECARCGAHLGHVFNDGPPPTGERHCLNSASLVFFEKGASRPPESQAAKTQVAYFAGGCFWGIQHYFKRGPGVVDAVSGYMQGQTDRPNYRQVSGHGTGHAETVKVVFDPSRITYRRLLEAFFKMHDPTQVGGQGPDIGSQYRSGIWTANDEQKREAEAVIRELETEERYGGRKIVTEVEPAKTFWSAEEYHQDYIAKTGAICHVTNPW